MSVLNKLKKFADKDYRDSFLQTQVRGGIAYQIQALRAKLGLTQTEFAHRMGKKQAVISRLESTSYGKMSVQTLLDIACSLDVALVVRFVSYPEFLQRTENMSIEALQPDSIFESLAGLCQTAQALNSPATPPFFSLEQAEEWQLRPPASKTVGILSAFRPAGRQDYLGTTSQVSRMDSNGSDKLPVFKGSALYAPHRYQQTGVST